MDQSLDRRAFIGLSAAFAALISRSGHSQAIPAPRVTNVPVKNRKNFVGIQVRAFSWVDEGVDQVLDNIQQKGDVNTVWAYTFSYGEARLQKNGPVPLPDHGKPGNTVAGGAFYDYDPQYFQNTILKDFRSKVYGNFNVIQAVAAKAKARGMSFFAWDLNNPGPTLNDTIPNYSEVSEVDVWGRRTNRPCFNNPDYQAFLSGKVESLLLGYPSEIDGIAWGSERMGPFENMIRGVTTPTCFCRYCQARARELDISVRRAQQGYRALAEFLQKAERNQRPTDGYFVTFWRLLLKYPEILSWESLWTDSFQFVQAQLYGQAKAIAPAKPFGFHIMQTMTFSPFYRAEEDYTKRRNFADFLKLATYNTAGGARLATYLKRLSETIFHDATPPEFIDFYYRIMNYQEAPYDKLAATGLSPEYVARETQRALEGVAGEVQIYPGIDINVPTLLKNHAPVAQTTPATVRASIQAALGAGADGVILSREYAEMWLANLTAGGDELRRIFAQQKS